MEKKVEISMLWQIYGKLLTEKQNQLIDYYYNNDLSLSEIAENENITRQAVRDIIKKGERKLFEYEEKLLFMRKTINQEKQIVMKTDNRSLFAYSIMSIANYGYQLTELSLDLYQDNVKDNIPTEYEERFANQGFPIYKLVAKKHD